MLCLIMKTFRHTQYLYLISMEKLLYFSAPQQCPFKMDTQNSDERKNIQINIFESMQIDFKPEKLKKRRKVDDYDYNDPFLESFEGEFDVVELECKLENFFVYKGKITEDPKKIARKYNNSLKKQKLVDTIQNNEQEFNEDSSKMLQFEFEKRLIKSINQSCKYRKDPRFDNALIWMVFIRSTFSEFERYLKHKIIFAFKQEGYLSTLNCSSVLENDFETEFKSLHSKIESCFKNYMECASCDKNFSIDMKNFEKLKDELFVDEMIEFIILYIAFYVCKTEKSVKHVKNLAIEYLSTILPEKCTNKTKIKHYIFKNICLKVESSGYDLEKVLAGQFMLKECNSKSAISTKNDNQITKAKKIDTSIDSESMKSIQDLNAYIKPESNYPAVKSSRKVKSNAERVPQKTKKVMPKCSQAFDIPKSQMLNSSSRYKSYLTDSVDNSGSISSINIFEPSFNENSVSIGTDLNPSSNSINLLSGSGNSIFSNICTKEKKNKQYSPPTFPVFSTSFLNTNHFKLNNSGKNEKIVMIESSLENTIPSIGDIHINNKLKGFLEYINPIHSIDENAIYNANDINNVDSLKGSSEFINPVQLTNDKPIDNKLLSYIATDGLSRKYENNESLDSTLNGVGQFINLAAYSDDKNLEILHNNECVNDHEVCKNTFDMPEKNLLTLSTNLNSTVIEDSSQDEDNHLTFNSN
ncbi:uncharacterized protein VICG_00606 [Vittaforma corneae ATCC 50505]|uniref:Uncharacterized protein n=1 Tax=Vittaforma corneae (strain ATCC 50505) TaxID=993615 RepID=L2GQA4_VITCO|nr:uncharacterized protein VICG_00606 [Vittaforma corneae ATCC 50505]ELA42507.1 hypothetical protein VICG_00606 [Vittaforma corneae ATCC 50505]